MDGQSALVPAVMLPMALLNPVYHRILCGGRKQKKKEEMKMTKNALPE
jgi:hypothetical protein